MSNPVKRSDPASLNPPLFSPQRRNHSLTVGAPAKINWFLDIVQKRNDGYHDIVSLMQCVNLYDQLILDHADSIDVESDMGIPASDNLVYKAASLLKKAVSYEKGARIIIRKQIPVGAGLGGGSSDAAYTLTGLNTLWGLGLQQEELCSIGACVGSDVPFFFHAPAALVEGKGERVSPLGIGESYRLLLVNPRLNVSTAWAYHAFDQRTGCTLTKKPIDIKLFCQALQNQDYHVLARMLFNDFEDVIMREYPSVREIKKKLIEMGADVSLMSGSGPTVFGVFRSRETAEKALQAMGPHWCRIVETLV
jgi:4-diphosphocytidyl-2-C-methyl-D-erythritol kinase